MVSEAMKKLGQQRSVIREIFEYGNQRRQEIGAAKVFDFSLGNPSIPAPACINETIKQLIDSTDSVALHGYTSAPGDMGLRQAIAADIQQKHGVNLSAANIYVTCGAAAALTISLKALTVAGDEIIAFTPFFPEYRVFAEAAGGKLVTVAARPDNFQLDLPAFEQALTPLTKAVILNSPNNPSGVVCPQQDIAALCGILKARAAQYGHPIYLITDEPYRELVYDGIEVPYLLNYYDDTLVCYSFSKSMSLPGERIGYIAVSPTMTDGAAVFAAVCGAGRALGYVCAPSLLQKVVAKCLGAVADVAAYRENRDLLYNSLSELGFNCIHPDGAFYLFVQSLEPDAWAFCEKAKKYELLLVPGDDFGCPGYVRIAYCVTKQMISNSLPAFAALASEYGAAR